jgi:hypothetical protein
MTQIINIVGSTLNRWQTRIEELYNTLYVDGCLGKINDPSTQSFRITDQNNTALKVIKIGITLLTLGIFPILFFGTLKGCKIMGKWILNNHEPMGQSIRDFFRISETIKT